MNTDIEQPRPVSDTPRTDEMEAVYRETGIVGPHVVDADFARQLERELNEYDDSLCKLYCHITEGNLSRPYRFDAIKDHIDDAITETCRVENQKTQEYADSLAAENARLRSVLESIYNEGRGSEVFPPSPDDGHDGLKFLAVQQAINPSPV